MWYWIDIETNPFFLFKFHGSVSSDDYQSQTVFDLIQTDGILFGILIDVMERASTFNWSMQLDIDFCVSIPVLTSSSTFSLGFNFNIWGFFFWRICEQWIIQKILHFPGSVWMLLTVALRQWNLRTQRTSNLQFIESIIQLNFPVLFIWDKRQVHEIHKIPHYLIHSGKYVRSIQPTLWSS